MVVFSTPVTRVTPSSAATLSTMESIVPEPMIARDVRLRDLNSSFVSVNLPRIAMVVLTAESSPVIDTTT